jgi:predicted anti-sigma-YlaC factor YlaD
MSNKVAARATNLPEPLDDLRGHLSISTLNSYHRRSLPSPKAARVRSHLVDCPACRSLLLDFARFLDDAQGPGGLTPEEMEEARRMMEASAKAHAR